MEQSWQVRAVWVDRAGSATEQRYQFGSYADARREVVRLFCHLGLVGADDRALRGLEIVGDFWAVPDLSVPASRRGRPTARPQP